MRSASTERRRRREPQSRLAPQVSSLAIQHHQDTEHLRLHTRLKGVVGKLMDYVSISTELLTVQRLPESSLSEQKHLLEELEDSQQVWQQRMCYALAVQEDVLSRCSKLRLSEVSSVLGSKPSDFKRIADLVAEAQNRVTVLLRKRRDDSTINNKVWEVFTALVQRIYEEFFRRRGSPEKEHGDEEVERVRAKLRAAEVQLLETSALLKSKDLEVNNLRRALESRHLASAHHSFSLETDLQHANERIVMLETELKRIREESFTPRRNFSVGESFPSPRSFASPRSTATVPDFQDLRAEYDVLYTEVQELRSWKQNKLTESSFDEMDLNARSARSPELTTTPRSRVQTSPSPRPASREGDFKLTLSREKEKSNSFFSQLQRKEKDISELQKAMAMLKAEVEHLHEVEVDYESKVKRQQEEVAKFLGLIKTLEEDKEQAYALVQQHYRDKLKAEREVTAMRMRLSSASDNETLVKQLRVAIEEKQQLARALSDAQGELARANDQATELQKPEIPKNNPIQDWKRVNVLLGEFEQRLESSMKITGLRTDALGTRLEKVVQAWPRLIKSAHNRATEAALKEELAASATELASLRSELATAGQSLHAFERQTTQKEHTIHSLQDEIRRVEGELTSVSEQLRTTEEELAAVRREADRSESELAALRSAVVDKDSEIASLRGSAEQQLSSLLTTAEHKSSELSTLQREVELLRAAGKEKHDELTTTKAALRTAETQLKAKSTSLDQLMTQHELAREHMAELKRENSSLGQAVEALRDLQEAVARAEEESKHLRSELAAEQKKLVATEKDAAAAQEALKEANRNIEARAAAAERSITALKEQIAALGSESEQLKAQRKDLEKALNSANEEVKSSRLEVEKLKGEVEHYSETREQLMRLSVTAQQHESYRSELKELNKKYERTSLELAERIEEAAAQAAELQECRDELAVCKDQMSGWRSQVEAFKGRMREQDTNIAAKTAELRETQRNLQAAVDAQNTANESSTALSSQLAAQRLELDQKQSDLEAAKSQQDILSQQIRSLQQQLLDSQAAHATLAAENKALRSEGRDAETRLAALEDALEDANRSESRHKAEIAQLAKDLDLTRAECQKLKHQITLPKAEKQKLKSENPQQLQELLKKQQAALAQVTEERDTLQQQVSSAMQELKQLQHSGEKLENKLKTLGRAADELEQIYVHFGVSAESRNPEEIYRLFNSLEGEKQQAKEESTKLRSEITRLQTEKSTAIQHNNEAQRLLEAEKQRSSSLERESEKTRLQLENAAQQTQDLTEELNLARESASAADTEAERVRQELNAANEKLTEKEAEVQQLTHILEQKREESQQLRHQITLQKQAKTKLKSENSQHLQDLLKRQEALLSQATEERDTCQRQLATATEQLQLKALSEKKAEERSARLQQELASIYESLSLPSASQSPEQITNLFTSLQSEKKQSAEQVLKQRAELERLITDHSATTRKLQETLLLLESEKQKSADLQRANDGLKSNLADMKQQSEGLQAKLREEVESLRVSLEKRLSEAQSELRSVNGLLAAEREAAATLRVAAEAHSVQIKQLQTRSDDRQAALTQALALRDSIERELASVRVAGEKRTNELRAQNETLQGRLELLRSEKASSDRRLDTARAIFAKEAASLESALKQAMQRVAEKAEATQAKANVLLQIAQRQFHALIVSRNSLHAALHSLLQNAQELDERTQNSMEDLDERMSDLSSKVNRVIPSVLSHTTSFLSRQRDSTTTKELEERRAMATAVAETHNSLNSQFRLLTRIVGELGNRLAHVMQRVPELKASIKRQREQLTAAIHNADEKAALHQNEVVRLSHELSFAQKKFTLLKLKRSRDAEEYTALLVTQRTAWTEAVDFLESRFSAYSEAATTQLGSLNSRITELSAKLQKSVQAVRHSANKKQDSREVERLTDMLARARRRIEDLQQEAKLAVPSIPQDLAATVLEKACALFRTSLQKAEAKLSVQQLRLQRLLATVPRLKPSVGNRSKIRNSLKKFEGMLLRKLQALGTHVNQLESRKLQTPEVEMYHFAMEIADQVETLILSRLEVVESRLDRLARTTETVINTQSEEIDHLRLTVTGSRLSEGSERDLRVSILSPTIEGVLGTASHFTVCKRAVYQNEVWCLVRVEDEERELYWWREDHLKQLDARSDYWPAIEEEVLQRQLQEVTSDRDKLREQIQGLQKALEFAGANLQKQSLAAALQDILSRAQTERVLGRASEVQEGTEGNVLTEGSVTVTGPNAEFAPFADTLARLTEENEEQNKTIADLSRQLELYKEALKRAGDTPVRRPDKLVETLHTLLEELPEQSPSCESLVNALFDHMLLTRDQIQNISTKRAALAPKPQEKKSWLSWR